LQAWQLKVKLKKKMGNLLYAIAVILVIIWAIGFFGYAAGGIIHLLLVIAIICVLLRVIRSA
jgi:tryptophan-rich sensory protein